MVSTVPAARADTITQWTLSGVTFAHGFTATGSFDFDVNTGIYSDLDISVFEDGSFLSAFTTANIATGSSASRFSLSGPESEEFLSLGFLTPLSTLPVPLQIGLASGFYHPCCGDGGVLTSGEIVSSPVPTPEPGSLALMLIGLGSLGLAAVTRESDGFERRSIASR
jgi:PEP-CTERM motif